MNTIAKGVVPRQFFFFGAFLVAAGAGFDGSRIALRATLNVHRFGLTFAPILLNFLFALGDDAGVDFLAHRRRIVEPAQSHINQLDAILAPRQFLARELPEARATLARSSS